MFLITIPEVRCQQAASNPICITCFPSSLLNSWEGCGHQSLLTSHALKHFLHQLLGPHSHLQYVQPGQVGQHISRISLKFYAQIIQNIKGDNKKDICSQCPILECSSTKCDLCTTARKVLFWDIHLTYWHTENERFTLHVTNNYFCLTAAHVTKVKACGRWLVAASDGQWYPKSHPYNIVTISMWRYLVKNTVIFDF